MAQVLSQDEVDALLQGISGGDIETETDEPVKEERVAKFDLTNQDRIVRGRLPALEMLHDRFCRSFRNAMSNLMRRPVDVNVLSNENLKYGEFMRTVPVPTSMHVFRLDPLKGLSLLVVEGKLVFALIDNFFGGKGATRYKLEGRDFTTIEQRVIRRVVDSVLENYQTAWKPIYDVTVEWVRAETNPQFANICLASDDIVAIQCEMDLEDSQGKLTFIIPYSSIEPIRDKMKAGYQREDSLIDSHWQRRFREQFREVPIDCHVELGHAKLTGRELLGLSVGSIITLDEDVSTPVQLYMEDVLKIEGYLGNSHSNLGVQISKLVRPPKGDDYNG